MEIEHALREVPGIFLRLNEQIPLSLIQRLKQRGFWFDDQDRFMKSAGIFNHWPEGRAIFVSSDFFVSVWVNEEDHLRIMSVVPGFDLPQAVAHLLPILKVLEQQLQFSYTQKLGFLTSCPTNLGTGCRVSMHANCYHESLIQLKSRGLAIRSKHGEKDSLCGDNDDFYDISVAQRLGITESQIMKKLYSSLVECII